MNKINILLIIGFMALTTNEALAQLYLRVGAGLATAKEQSSVGTSVIDGTTTMLYGTNAAGLNAGLSVGFRLSSNLAVEVGGGYLMGSSVTTSEIEETGAFSSTEALTTQSSSILSVSPSLVVSAGDGGIKPYARFGLVLPIGGSTIVESSSTQETAIGSIVTEYTAEASGNPSVGYIGGLGAELSLGESFAIYGELGMQMLAIFPSSSVITKYEVNGTDQLVNFTTAQKEINFVREITSSSNTGINTDTSKPLDELGSYSNYNNVGISLGIRINL